MEVIDTVPADSVEIGDLISYAGDEIEILDVLESDDITRVSFKVYNMASGMVEPLSIRFDQMVNILGA